MDNATFEPARQLIAKGLSLKLNDFSQKLAPTDPAAHKQMEPRASDRPRALNEQDANQDPT